LWGGTNIREDIYGGSIEKRSQFVTDIIRAVRDNVSDKFIVGLRFSQWKQHDFEAKLAATPDDLKKILLPPVAAGLDYLHSSMRRFWESEFKDSEENLAFWTKKISNIPTIGVGSVGLDSDFIDMTAPATPMSIDKAIEDISNEKYDLIAVGRALLSDYEWVLKMKEGRLKDVIPYTKEALLNLY
jgi:2,4-dienoyl-CoA reductase-like NADH-dependent reductase (Old Yellow Enzyme family)